MNRSVGEDKPITDEMIMNCIYVVRGQKVMIDVDLASLYRLETKQFTGEVMGNSGHFPKDLIFELNDEDFLLLFKQNHALKKKLMGRDARIAFTEKAIPMLGGILQHERIGKVNCRVIRIFYHIRQILDHYPDLGMD